MRSVFELNIIITI